MKRLAGGINASPNAAISRGHANETSITSWHLRPKISLKQNILPQQRKFQQPARACQSSTFSL